MSLFRVEAWYDKDNNLKYWQSFTIPIMPFYFEISYEQGEFYLSGIDLCGDKCVFLGGIKNKLWRESQWNLHYFASW